MMRSMPHVVVRAKSPFQSARSDRIRLIVIHATEGHNRPGVEDLRSLGEWFQNPDARVSCHVATDDEGNSARFVADRYKAWHCAAFNSAALGVEQVGSSDQLSWRRPEIRETARWVAYWSRKYGVPIRHGKVNGGAVVLSGVVRHSDLGEAGGNHGDPGAGYPLGSMLRLARVYKLAQVGRR